MPATVAALAVSFSVLLQLFLHGREHFGVDQGRNRDSDPLLLLHAIDGAIASGLLRLAAHRPEAGVRTPPGPCRPGCARDCEWYFDPRNPSPWVFAALPRVSGGGSRLGWRVRGPPR